MSHPIHKGKQFGANENKIFLVIKQVLSRDACSFRARSFFPDEQKMS